MGSVKNIDMMEELTDDREDYEELIEEGLVSGPDDFLLRPQAP